MNDNGVLSLEKQINECDELYFKSDYRGLIKKCDEILKHFPENPNSMGYKGISHCFLDEYDEALKILKKGMELYPDNYYFKNNLAMVYYDLGDFEKSLELCEEGLKIKKFDWLCDNKLRALVKLGRMDEAIEFDRTLDFDFDLGGVLFDVGMPHEAINYYYGKLMDNPDEIYIIDMIKMIVCHSDLNCTPDIGDYYLKWIDYINYADGNVFVECDNRKLRVYALFKMFTLELILKRDSKRRFELDGLKRKLLTFDDREFDAFISRLVEIGYFFQPEDGCVDLACNLESATSTVQRLMR